MSRSREEEGCGSGTFSSHHTYSENMHLMFLSAPFYSSWSCGTGMCCHIKQQREINFCLFFGCYF